MRPSYLEYDDVKAYLAPGFSNPRNNCYINSIVHCYFNTCQLKHLCEQLFTSHEESCQYGIYRVNSAIIDQHIWPSRIFSPVYMGPLIRILIHPSIHVSTSILIATLDSTQFSVIHIQIQTSRVLCKRGYRPLLQIPILIHFMIGVYHSGLSTIYNIS